MTDIENCRVLIAEDHEIVRVGLRLILEEWEGFEVVGEACNGQEAVEMACQHVPDVVLMDVVMPVIDGVTATQKIKDAEPEVRVIMLTSSKEIETVFASLASGAQGYCLKDVSTARLRAGMECVKLGDLWIDNEVAAMLSKAIATDSIGLRPPMRKRSTGVADGARTAEKTEKGEKTEKLTPREQEILELIVEGLSNVEIAERLFVTKDTIKTHVHSILDKLAASDRTQAAVKAIRTGLLS